MTDNDHTTTTNALAIVPRTFSEVSTLAETIAKSGLLPVALRGKVPDVLMTIMAGQELGIPPIAALRSIHVIEGKTVLSADVMVATVLSRGAAVYFRRISADDTQATYETLRRGETTPQRMTWTIEQAKAAGLHQKDNWRLFRRQMLSARCKAELARDVYPDVLAGCYTADELDASEQRQVYVEPPPSSPAAANADAIDAEYVDAPAVVAVVAPTSDRDQLIADINACQSQEQVDALIPRCATFKGDDRKLIGRVFTAAKSVLPLTAPIVEQSTVIDAQSTEVAA